VAQAVSVLVEGFGCRAVAPAQLRRQRRKQQKLPRGGHRPFSGQQRPGTQSDHGQVAQKYGSSGEAEPWASKLSGLGSCPFGRRRHRHLREKTKCKNKRLERSQGLGQEPGLAPSSSPPVGNRQSSQQWHQTQETRKCQNTRQTPLIIATWHPETESRIT
jgi:hypothetical protein